MWNWCFSSNSKYHGGQQLTCCAEKYVWDAIDSGSCLVLSFKTQGILSPSILMKNLKTYTGNLELSSFSWITEDITASLCSVSANWVSLLMFVDKLSQFFMFYGSRFSKESFCHLLNMIQGDLERSDNRGRPLPAVYQLLIALHFYCSGSYQVRVICHWPSAKFFMTA